MRSNRLTVVGLDVGSTKTVCMVGEVTEKGVKILGKGEVKTGGFRLGQVVDTTRAQKTVQESIRAARVVSNRDIESAYFSVEGLHLRVERVGSTISLNKKVVTEEDIRRTTDLATEKIKSEKKLASDERIIQIVPYRFLINEKDEVEFPAGMTASKLTVELSVIVGNSFKVDNIVNVLKNSGLTSYELVASHIANGVGVRTSDFKENVVGVIDLGHSLVKVSVFRGGNLEFIDTLEWGVKWITNDVANWWRITQQEAEKLKLRYGVAYHSPADDPELQVEALSLDRVKRKYPLIELIDIVNARQVEILELAYEKLKEAPSFDRLNHIYLIGGGARLQKVRDLAEDIFGRDVVVGRPTGVSPVDGTIMSPEYVTAVGLVKLHAVALQSRKKKGSFKKAFRKVVEMFS